ncbi:hypothetical protein J0H58_29495 [bacterium]|nr:hypothetical protein [bacterium]
MPNAPRILPLQPNRAGRPVRASTAARGYGSAHRRQRERLLKAHPLCQRCGQNWSTHLHHRDRNPFNRDDANAEMLCEPCHQQEHAGG